MERSGACNRCGRKVLHYDFSAGKLTIVNPEQIRQTAFWCETCREVLCAKCAGLNLSGEGFMTLCGWCSVCKNPVNAAEPHHLLLDSSATAPDDMEPCPQHEGPDLNSEDADDISLNLRDCPHCSTRISLRLKCLIVCLLLSLWFAYDGFFNKGFISMHTDQEGNPSSTLIFNRGAAKVLICVSVLIAIWGPLAYIASMGRSLATRQWRQHKNI